MGAGHGDVEHEARLHVGGGGAAANHRSAAGPHAAGSALGTAQAELGHGGLGGQAHPGGLGGDEGLEVHAVQQGGFQHLAVHDAAHHPHQGLPGKHDGAFDDGVNVHIKMEGAQMLQELGLEELAAGGRRKRGQVGQVLFREVEVPHDVGQLRHAAGHRVAALEGVVAEEHVEAGLGFGFTGLPIALRHGEFVEVGQQYLT